MYKWKLSSDASFVNSPLTPSAAEFNILQNMFSEPPI